MQHRSALRAAGAWLILALAFTNGAHAAPDRVRFLEGAAATAKLSPAELAEEAKPYLAPGIIDAQAAIGPPPAVDSAEDKADVAASRAANEHASAARWRLAVEDDASVYDRFDKAFGVPLNRAHLPRAVRMLNRVSADVLAVAGEAKAKFARPRPFQRFALPHVCGQAHPPKPEAAPKTATSYPSGHAVVSWALVLVLDEVAPEQAQALIARGLEYSQSRVVCGAHFPRDVEAGRILASIVVDRLIALPEFRRDVACAKTEYRAVLAGEKSEDLPACQ